MRKEDRVATNREQSRTPSEKQSQPRPVDQERMKGSASQQPDRLKREPGKLPLPD